ncbi:MAG: metallophosphoesterase [Acidobacteria bacterium]|nr:metallophosphoesterase [Acidobacteriota bacterium]
MRRLVVVAALASLLQAASAARGPECEFTGVQRVVAIGDVHGAYDQLVQILRTAGVVTDRLRWSGGKTHLVQVGDVVDRGPDSRRVLDLYRRLEGEASSAGGRVHVLLGNHEVMRLVGDYRYTTAGEYQAFATRSSAALRAEFVDAVEDPQLKKHFASQPLGALEMIRAFGARETYGAYLRRLNAVVRINDVVFVHGGISPADAALSCGEINDRIRRDITDDMAATTANPAEAWSMRSDGPLWYRGLAQGPDTFAPEVDAILAGQQARAMVVAHTPQESGRIAVKFGGRVFVIDTGMQPEYVPTGRPSALELVGDAATAIYPQGRELLGRLPPLPVPAAAAAR